MSLEYYQLDDTVYFAFAGNDTSGSGGDGASPLFDVRLCGAAADAAPVYSGSATLLTHASYPDGAHEVEIVASEANGFAAGNTYTVYCTLLVDSQNPTGVVGKFKLDRQLVDAVELGSDAQSLADLKDLADTGYNPATHKLAGVVLADTCTTNTDMRGTDSAATATALATHDGKLDTVAGDVANIDGAAMRGTDSAALASALATHDGKLDTADEVVDAALAILKADKVIDTGEDPWELVLYTQGAEQIPENEIFRKALSQPDGTAVSSSDHIVGQEEHTT